MYCPLNNTHIYFTKLRPCSVSGQLHDQPTAWSVTYQYLLYNVRKPTRRDLILGPLIHIFNGYQRGVGALFGGGKA
jgi:hypothetical protein